MAISWSPTVVTSVMRPSQPVSVAGGVVTPLPAPKDSPLPTLPDPRTGADWVMVLVNPIRTIKSLFTWIGGITGFDALGAITPANATAAEAKLTAADAALSSSGLGRALPFMARAVDKRAAAAVTQLRPGVEQVLGQRAGHSLNLMWPVGGSNLAALHELQTFGQTFKEYPDATVQKALAGIASIDVQALNVWDMANPIKRQAATLIVQRPLSWLPGQTPTVDSLRAFLTRTGTVTASV